MERYIKTHCTVQEVYLERRTELRQTSESLGGNQGGQL